MIRFVHGLELDGFAARCRWKPASYRIRVDVLWPACHGVHLSGKEFRCTQEEVVHRVRKIPRDVYVGTRGEAAMKITQDLVTQAFMARNGTTGYYSCKDDVKRIQEVLHKNHGIFISESEAIDFWRWRCQEWDGSWFGVDVERDADLIEEYFQGFLKFVGVETDEDNEDYSGPNQRVGVKVIVKDVDGVPWELELEPEYHAQLISELEAQIPEKSEGGSIRYSLEYNPEKIWNARKMDENERALSVFSVREGEKFSK